MEMKEINIGDYVWYFRQFDDDYYGKPIRGISELKYGKVVNIANETTYHNLIYINYSLDNGETISNIVYTICLNENEAINKYNDCINNQIAICNNRINEIINMRKELESQIIRTNII